MHQIRYRCIFETVSSFGAAILNFVTVDIFDNVEHCCSCGHLINVIYLTLPQHFGMETIYDTHSSVFTWFRKFWPPFPVLYLENGSRYRHALNGTLKAGHSATMSQKIIVVKSLQLHELPQKPRWRVIYPPRCRYKGLKGRFRRMSHNWQFHI